MLNCFSFHFKGGTVGEVCMRGKNNQVILKGFENEDTDFDKKELDVSISNIVFAYFHTYEKMA